MVMVPDKEEILAMPILHSSQYDDLKFEDGSTRIWVSRIEEMRDGSPQVTVEKLVEGSWLPDEIF